MRDRNLTRDSPASQATDLGAAIVADTRAAVIHLDRALATLAAAQADLGDWVQDARARLDGVKRRLARAAPLPSSERAL